MNPCPNCSSLNTVLIRKDYDYDDANGGWGFDVMVCRDCEAEYQTNEEFLGYAEDNSDD